MQPRIFRSHLLLACAGFVFNLASLSANADALHVTVASASNNKAYDLSFTPPTGTATALGTNALPASPASSVRSIIYIGNEQTSTTDLIAADYNGNRIVRYAGASGPANVFWAYSTGTPGPRYPEGLAVDSSANLYANRGETGRPQVWVFKRDPAQPAGAALLAPVLMVDSSSISNYGNVRLMDALVVPAATAGGLGAGDLLVLVSDGRVLRFPAAKIKNFLAGAGPVGAPITLVAAAQCPRGQTPTGMALWPADGSLLVATVGGNLLSYSLTGTGSTLNPAFATGLGASLGKIRTFMRAGTSYAVFDQPIRGKIFEFGAPPTGGCPNLAVVCNSPLATITTVSYPVGLATTDTSVPSSACNTNVNPGGCSLLGGMIVIKDNKAPANGTLLVTSCSVDSDPRFDTVLGACDEAKLNRPSDPHLYADDVCPGYPHTRVPIELCGASGASGHGLTIAKITESNGFVTSPFDLVVSSDVNPLGNAPACPQLTDGWAPLASEGSISDGNVFIDLPGGCDGSIGLKPGHSLDLIGVQLNDTNLGDGVTSWLVAYANQKFDSLSATVAALTTTGATPNIGATDKAQLAGCVTTAKGYLNDNSLASDSRYQCAAHQAWSCDSTLGTTNPILNNTNQLSLYSELRGRLQNLVMHLNSRIRGQATSATLPPPDPGLPSGGCTAAPAEVPPTAPSIVTDTYFDPYDPTAGWTNAHWTNTDRYAVSLTWTASSDPDNTPVTGYTVYMSRDGGINQYGAPVAVATTDANTLTAVVDLTPNYPATGESFQFSVVAKDSANNNSQPSNTVTLSFYFPIL
jgi:hypothetical protein